MHFFTKAQSRRVTKAHSDYVPWNKGKIIGQKPLQQAKHVSAIRTRLQSAKNLRDLAMFNLAIDSKLRACDVVALKVEDVAPNSYAVDRATIRQMKTNRPVTFEITEQTRQAIDDDLPTKDKSPADYLFSGRRAPDRGLSTRQNALLVSEWISSIGLDALRYGARSLRRTKATLTYRRPRPPLPALEPFPKRISSSRRS